MMDGGPALNINVLARFENRGIDTRKVIEYFMARLREWRQANS